MLPMAVMTAISSPLSGRIVGSRGPRLPLIGAGLGMTASALALTQLAPGTSTGLLVVSYLLFGLGFGLVNAPITNTAMAGMPRAQAGVAGAVATTSRQVGASLGVAGIGPVVEPAMTGPIKTSFAPPSQPGAGGLAGC